MGKNGKKFLSLLLVVAMLASLVVVPAFADETTSDVPDLTLTALGDENPDGGGNLPASEEKLCICNAAEGEPHEEGCPLYEVPQGTVESGDGDASIDAKEEQPNLDVSQFQITVNCVNEERGHSTFETETGSTVGPVSFKSYNLRKEDCTLAGNDDSTWTLTVDVAYYLDQFNSVAVYRHVPLADPATVTLRQDGDHWVMDGTLEVDAVCTPMTNTGNPGTQLGVLVNCVEKGGHNLPWKEVDRSAFTTNPGNLPIEENQGSAAYPSTAYPFCVTYTMGLEEQADFLTWYYNALLELDGWKNALEHEHMLASSSREQSVTYYWDKENSGWVRDGKSYFTIDAEEACAAVWVLDQSGEKLQEFDKLQDGIDFAEDGQTVQMWKNVTEDVTVKDKSITLDLNGHTVDGGGKNTVLIIDGGSVTLTGDGTITGGRNVKFPNGGGVTITNNGTFTMENGTITKNTAKENGGGVFVYHGTFTMKGGTISENDGGNYGGGVYVYNSLKDRSAQFTMDGGRICNNRAGSGGGVGMSAYLQENEGRLAIILNKGTIDHNTVTGDGGGVAIASTVGSPVYGYSGNETGRHRMQINAGVTISQNSANLGGGVYSADSITEINGATITENKATGVSGNGGGVYVQAGTVTLTDVTIMRNSAMYGGGIFAGHKTEDSTVTMNSGKLYGNTASRSSADVYCNELTTLTLPDARTMNGTLNNAPITGWYWDGGGQYAWSANYIVERNLTSGVKAKQCLIAAYNPEPVARIRETGKEFATLQEAVDTAISGQTVEVLKDTNGAMLMKAKSITVDIPAGLTVSNVISNGKLYNYAFVVANEGAELTLTGAGTIQGTTYGAVIQKHGKLTVNMNGGAVTGGSYALYAQTYGTIDMSSGTVTGGRNGIRAGEYVKAVVSGGTVKADRSIPNATPDLQFNAIFGISMTRSAEVTVTGNAVVEGTYAGVSIQGGQTGYTEVAPKLIVNGGTITGMYGITGNGSADGTSIEINGGKVTSPDATAIYHPQVGEMTITGGEITGANGIQFSGAGQITIAGGKITATMETTDAPQKPSLHTDGTIADGAALSMLSRGSGWQSSADEVMNVTITGGELISEHNSAIAVYRIKQDKETSEWVVGDATGLTSYLGSLVIREGTDESGNKTIPVFTGNPQKGVLDIEALAMDAKTITGGTFSQDVNGYQADTYVSHPISTTFYGNGGYYNVHQPANSGYAYDASNHWRGCNGHPNCTYGRDNVAAHTYGAWIVDRAATIQAPGARHRDCTACGYRQTGTIAQLSGGGGTGGGGGGGGSTGGGGTGGTTTIIDEEVPLAGGIQLNREDHFAYISGYADGTVRPLNNITREEVAALFYRLLTDTSRTIYETDSNNFNDVDNTRWSNRAISTLTNAGIISGYPDGTFRPGQTITRAEFAAIAARFDVVTEGLDNPFSDTAEHWAKDLISYAASKGWVSGYPDGTFLPQKAITRAEAMALVNNVLSREVDEEGLLSNAKQWPDNEKGAWYYYEVLEATNSHDYTRRSADGLVENWTAITSD